MAACRTCEARLRWALSDRTGKPMPFDATPVGDGTFVIEYQNGGDVARAATDDDRRLKRELFKPHFATCPQAAQWRKS